MNSPIKLTGNWLFTRDDLPQNKEVGIDTSAWKLAKAPGPWKHIYDDHKNFTVGWYRGNLEFSPDLVGQEVVLMTNTYMARMNVYVDGQEVYRRPHNINVERYYSIQPVPIRFKVTSLKHVVTMRVETPLMTGVYQLPFELHKYNQHDTSLVWHQVYGGEARMIVAYTVLAFGLFFLLVYSKTKFTAYLMVALGDIAIFPFFASPGDYFLKVFEPETMLYWHYTGLLGIFFILTFCQFMYDKVKPKLLWVSGSVYVALVLIIGSMVIHPNIDLLQKTRPILLVFTLVSGAYIMYQLWQAHKEKKQGALVLFFCAFVFLACGINDVLLALGKISSMAMIFGGTAVFMGGAIYVASMSFANTFVDNKRLVKDLKGMNDNLEDLVTERTQQLRVKTQDIHSMLQNMPQGVLTITNGSLVHPEYSAYLETIFETKDIAGKEIMTLIFADTDLGSDALSQVEAAASSCIGEDSMNFEFNAHLLVKDVNKTMPDGRVKSLELSWSPICDDADTVEKLMLCVRDVTEFKRLEGEANEQKRELEIIGEILAVSQEKFQEFVESAGKFIQENRALIEQTTSKSLDTIGLLFRNMHTIKGNARTYGFANLTDLVHETEQVYDEMRKNDEAEWHQDELLAQLEAVKVLIDEYAKINDNVLGRKGPGRRGNVEKFLMVEKDQVENSLQMLQSLDQNDLIAMRGALNQIGRTLTLIGTDRVDHVLSGVLESMPSLAHELGKEAPIVQIDDHGILVRNQVNGLLRNLFTHLMRNCVDHGIETAEVRVSKGKPAAGRIEIDLSLSGGKLWIKAKDDGRGVAIAKIRENALSQQLITPEQAKSAQTVAETIFLSGFSTAEKVTEVSGRGVGMDAIKGFLEAEGGAIDVHFLDEAEADFRPFELVISLPEKFAVLADVFARAQAPSAVLAGAAVAAG
ncbi:MAG: Hpt domain-containing protein [Pseudomonadota bacterium]